MATSTHRSGLIALLTTAVALALVGGALVVLFEFADEPDAPPVTTVSPTATAETRAPATPPDVPVRTDEMSDDAGDDGTSRDGLAAPPLGIATTEYEWATTELTASSGGESWVHQLVAVNDELWAVGSEYRPDEDRSQAFVYSTTDGIEWERKALPDEIAAAGHAQLYTTESGAVAVVNAWDSTAEMPTLSVFMTTDGDTWVRSDPSTLVGSDQHMWIDTVASSGGVVVATAGHAPRSAEPHEPPIITIEQDGYVIQLDDATYSYLITDAVTGEVVVHGSQEMIWTHTGVEGIYDPDRGEIVFTMNWQTLDAAAVDAYESAVWGEPLIIAVTDEDRTLRIDEFSGEFTVTDAAGSVIFEGTEQDMWQGPPPTFRDRDGNVLVVVSWEVWDEAHVAAWGEPEHPEHVILRSADEGETWQLVPLPEIVDEDFYFQMLVGGPDGFLAVGTTEPIYEEWASEASPVVLHSADGSEWTWQESTLGATDWLNGLTAVDDGYLAVRSGLRGATELVTSADGVTWTPILEPADLETEIGRVWLDRPGRGGLGTFVTGSYDANPEIAPVPATIRRDGRTLTVLGHVYEVTDDATGAVLFSHDETDSMDHGHGIGAPESGFVWGRGGIVMFDGDGGVIFAASHYEFEAAMEHMWSEPDVYYEPQPVLLLIAGDGVVTQVPLPEDLGPHVWFSGMVVTDDRIVLTYTGETHSQFDYDVRCVALVGTPLP